MLTPMRIARTATTPRAEDERRRMLSVRLAVFDDHRVQEQPEPDEGGEEDDVTQGDDAARERLEARGNGDATRDVGEHRCVARQKIRYQRIGGDGENEADRDAEHIGDYLVFRARRQRGTDRE